MSDPRRSHDLDATRFGLEETEVDETLVEPIPAQPVRTQEQAMDDTQAEEPAATVFDPYATAMPSTDDRTAIDPPSQGAEDRAKLDSVFAEPLFDPYATRLDTTANSSGSAGSTGLDQTIPWDGAGAAPGSMSGGPVSRFRPLKLHARGGLGEVYVAVDGELNREVALKEIQERHGGHAESQVRFVFEAEITGGLEHPGIVPVYGLGRYADGRPYYAMRFIRGDSLKAAIEKFQKSDEVKNATSLRHSLTLHQLLSRFVTVCYAIDYAHSRGVLHRDLKPDNIMLGGHGETLVVDWGLAKALNRPDPVDESDPKPLRPLSGNDTTATMDGAVMGTPSFMSPEQAAGELDKLGPGSDIFSLGSTLYALLTGKAPFRDLPIHDLLEKVRKADFAPPREINRAIPPALEAICLKAMALQPKDRYPTASALAADLERWIADEPVEAYPEPWIVRAGRWARRHKTAVAASFVLLATASTALGISTVLIGREKARTEHNYQIARKAVEEMLTQVGEVDLADVPQLETVRRDLLARALTFYRAFLAERGRDSSAQLETGRALARLGDIREQLGQYVQAETDYRDALKILAKNPSDLDTRRALARTKVNLGILLKKSNRYLESEAFFRDGLKERQALAAEHPEDADDARALALARYQLGTLLARLKDRSKEDEADYLQAIAEQEALIQKPAATVEQRRELARYLNNLGNLQSGSRRDDAEKTFRKALQIQDEIEAQSASSAGFRWQRARTWNNLATLLLNLRRYDEADPFFARAKQAFEALEADFPTVPDYHRELAMSLNNYGLLLNARPSKTTNPIDLFRQAEADQRRLATEYPEVPDHKIRLSVTCLNLGDRLRTTDPVEADARFLEGIAIQEKLTTDFPQVPEYQAALGRTLTLRAALLADQNKRADAVVLLDQAIPALEKARQGNPREQNYRVFVYDAHDQKGKNLAILGRAAELAIEADQLTKAIPDRPDSYLQAANFLAKAAELAGSDANQAETYAKSAVKALRDALDKGANDPAILDRVDLKSLRNRPDFQKLRDDWNTKGKKATV